MSHIYIVTIKEKQAFHNPRNKQTGKCPVAAICTDKTGAHHSLLVKADSIEICKEKVSKTYNHITRIELVKSFFE